MRTFFLNLLDKHSSQSSKRFVGIVCLAMVVIGFIASTFFSFKIDEMVFKTLEYLIIIAIFGTVADNYVNKDKIKENADNN